MFDKLIQVLVLGAAYERITAGVLTALEPLCLEAYDRIVGLQLAELIVDGCIVKGPCGGMASDRSRVDRGNRVTKRFLLTEAAGIPLDCVIARANRHDSVLLRPTLETLGRF